MDNKIVALLLVVFSLFVIGCVKETIVYVPVDEQGVPIQQGAENTNSEMVGDVEQDIVDVYGDFEDESSNFDDDLVDERSQPCPKNIDPVCGVDEKTYDNECVAKVWNGVEVAYKGECKIDIIGPIEEKCVEGGGVWKILPNGCVDSCNAQICIQVPTAGCDCGENYCWDGSECVKDDSE